MCVHSPGKILTHSECDIQAFDASRGVKKRCQTWHRAFTALIYRCHVWHRFLTPRLASKSLYVTLRMGKDFPRRVYQAYSFNTQWTKVWKRFQARFLPYRNSSMLRKTIIFINSQLYKLILSSLSKFTSHMCWSLFPLNEISCFCCFTSKCTH